MPGPYKIGEAAALLDLKTYVLRFWETEFPQIVPLRTETGRRVYTDEHLALLERIRFLLYDHGLTIEGARRILNEEAAKGVRYTPSDVAKLSADGETVLAPTTPVEPQLDGVSTPGAPSGKSAAKESAVDKAFWDEIRAELEDVAAFLAAPTGKGGKRP